MTTTLRGLLGVAVSPLAKSSYTTGAGTHVFNPAATKYRLVGVAGGGGGSRAADGSSNGGGGGGAGEYIDDWFDVPDSGSLTYEIGAAGAPGTTSGSAGTDGGRTRFGTIVLQGGKGGAANGGGGRGGGIDTGTTPSYGKGRIPGGGGGTGTAANTGTGASHGGRGPGFPTPNPVNTNDGTLVSSGSPSVSFGGGGGSSPLGQGADGTSTTGGAASGYGAGGAGGRGAATSFAGSAGTGGKAQIEEYL